MYLLCTRVIEPLKESVECSSVVVLLCCRFVLRAQSTVSLSSVERDQSAHTPLSISLSLCLCTSSHMSLVNVIVPYSELEKCYATSGSSTRQ